MRPLLLVVLGLGCSDSGSGPDGGGADGGARGDGATGGDGGATSCPADPSYAGPADYELPRGWFYGQRGCGPGAGYAVTDEPDPATGGRPARFFTFHRLLEELGYPRSSRFTGADGRVRQLFDAGLAVADPATGQVHLDDVLARASDAENDRLAAYGVPRPGAGASFGNAAIEDAWRRGPDNPAWCPFTEADAELLFGRPAAPLADGVQRFDRVVYGETGALLELGEALAAVAPEAAPGDATFIPAAARFGVPAPAAPRALEPLRVQLETRLATWAGDVAVAVTDLQTGETIAVNGDRKQTSASSIKWWMITACLVALDEGTAGFTLADIEPPSRDILQFSTNDDASTLVSLVGGDTINRHMLWQGMTRSALVGWTPYANACYRDPPEDGFFNWNNHLTVRDANRGLATLWAGHVLSPGSQAWLIDTAIALTPNWYFGSRFPVAQRDLSWAHKVGFIPPEAYGPEDETLNDVGLVYVNDDGFAFALSILSLHNADHDAADELLADLGLEVFDFLDALY